MTSTNSGPRLEPADASAMPAPGPRDDADDWTIVGFTWWAEAGYVPAQFGTERVLLTPDFAADLKLYKAAQR